MVQASTIAIVAVNHNSKVTLDDTPFVLTHIDLMKGAEEIGVLVMGLLVTEWSQLVERKGLAAGWVTLSSDILLPGRSSAIDRDVAHHRDEV